MRVARHSGFTVVELMVAMSILALVTGTVFTLSRATSDAYETVALSAHNDARGYAALRKVKDLLRSTGAEQIDPRPQAPLFSTDAEFQRDTGVVDGVRTWGPLQRVQLDPDPLDPVNGLDDDGDGLVDERELVWVQDVGTAEERRFVVCRNVASMMLGEDLNGVDDNGNGLIDEPGACFSYTDEGVTFRLTVVQPMPEGVVVSSIYETTVWLIN